MPDADEINHKIQQTGGGWVAGDNPIAALPEAQKRLRLGAVAPRGWAVSSLFKRLIPDASDNLVANAIIGPSFDLRSVNGARYTTPVRDQSTCNSCVAFACVATIEHVLAYQAQTANPATDLSEAHLFFGYGRHTCAQGWWPSSALSFCRRNPTSGEGGITEDQFYKYDISNTDSLHGNWQNSRRYIATYRLLPRSRTEIQRYISMYGSVVACMYVYQDFDYYVGNGVYRHVSGKYRGGHCVSLIGYNDDPNERCWIAKNSWGPFWGDNGFFKIAYGQCGIDSWGCFALIP